MENLKHKTEKKEITSRQRGFTLIEMLVSVALFIIVMVVALGALLAMSQSDRKAESLKVVINNLSSAFDSMSRTIRTGKNYHCGTSGTLTTPQSCTSGDTWFTFLQSDNNTLTVYCFDSTAQQMRRYTTTMANASDLSNHTTCVSTDTQLVPLTSPEMKIKSMSFYVTDPTVGHQPKVTILMQGHVDVTATQSTELKLQTSVTQRLYNQ